MVVAPTKGGGEKKKCIVSLLAVDNAPVCHRRGEEGGGVGRKKSIRGLSNATYMREERGREGVLRFDIAIFPFRPSSTADPK